MKPLEITARKPPKAARGKRLSPSPALRRGRKPQIPAENRAGEKRFSRRAKPMKNKEIKRGERDYRIFRSTPLTILILACMRGGAIISRGFLQPGRSHGRDVGCDSVDQSPPSEGNPMPNMLFCLNCRFFCTLEGVRADDLPSDMDECMQGHCRRNTPAVGRFRGENEELEYDYGQWPLILACDWCGRFEPCQRALREGAAQTRHVCAGCDISGAVEPTPTRARRANPQPRVMRLLNRHREMRAVPSCRKSLWLRRERSRWDTQFVLTVRFSETQHTEVHHAG